MKRLIVASILIGCLLVPVSCAKAPPPASTQSPVPTSVSASKAEVNTDGFYMPPEVEVKITNGSHISMYWMCEFSVPITNKGGETATHILTWWNSIDMVEHTQEVTLGPGETYAWSDWRYIDFRRIDEYSVWLSGDWEGNNFSAGTVRA